jgi:N-acetylmuramoyl-L-alanine amidase
MTYSGLIKVWATVLAAILAATFLSMTVSTTGAGAQEGDCSGKVVLDAGHGGTDSGAVNTGYGLKEKDQTLDIATDLKTLLEGDGCTVYMTRTEDQNLTNTQRANKANSFKANDPGAYVLVSIHLNGSTDETVDYTTTLFGKWRKDKELAYAVFGDNVNAPKIDPPTYGLRTLSAVNGGGTTWGTISTKTPYSFASGVLLKSNMPATIAETVFITNDREGQLLSNGTGARQQQIEEALRLGIEAYLADH